MEAQRGFALPDLVVTLVVFFFLLAIGYVLVSCSYRNQTGGTSDSRQHDREVAMQEQVVVDPPAIFWPSESVRQRDASQLRLVHQAMHVYARDDDGWMPMPGRIRRKPVEFQGREQFIPGRGEIDPLLNTTANLYSAMITQSYLTPTGVVSPWERNPRVSAIEQFNWEKYNPIEGEYWDDAFKADLEQQSHASYAHLLLYGSRLERQWRDTMDSQFAVFSNRGPKGGKGDSNSFTCDDAGTWQGHVVFNDNAVKWLDTMTPAGVRFVHDGLVHPDNLFAIDSGIHGGDVILTFTKSIDADGPTIQHD